MKTKVILVSLVLGLLLLGACSSGKTQSGMRAVFQPEWYSLQGDANYVFTYGQSERVSQNASEQSAYANAMQEAAQYVEAHVQGMVDNYVEEAGINDPEVLSRTRSMVRVISNAKFSGTQIVRRETFINEDGRYHTFVRVSIPKDEINRTTRNQIRNDEALYHQFRATQAFQELDQLLERQP